MNRVSLHSTRLSSTLLIWFDMLKDLSELQKKSPAFRKKFLKNCKVFEKFDAHRVSVEILSEDHIKFRKSGNKEIRQEDLILYPEWSKFIEDFKIFLYINKEWTRNHKGTVIRMYFFPSQQPAKVKYNHSYRYIVDTIETFSGKKLPNDALEQLSTTPELENKFSHVKEVEGDISLPVDVSKLSGLLSDEPAGLVLNFGNKSYLLPILYTSSQEDRSSEMYYELLLCSLVDWARHNDDWKKLVTDNYVKTVCMIYNSYMQSQQAKDFCMGVNPENIEIKHSNGEVPEINLSYVPSLKTRELCSESRMNKAIFKVFLANLGHKHRKFRYVPPKKCEYLNDMTRLINLHRV